eukprot:Clim_evm8s40 gene=Clim_evmTU8s40
MSLPSGRESFRDSRTSVNNTSSRESGRGSAFDFAGPELIEEREKTKKSRMSWSRLAKRIRKLRKSDKPAEGIKTKAMRAEADAVNTALTTGEDYNLVKDKKVSPKRDPKRESKRLLKGDKRDSRSTEGMRRSLSSNLIFRTSKSEKSPEGAQETGTAALTVGRPRSRTISAAEAGDGPAVIASDASIKGVRRISSQILLSNVGAGGAEDTDVLNPFGATSSPRTSRRAPAGGATPRRHSGLLLNSVEGMAGGQTSGVGSPRPRGMVYAPGRPSNLGPGSTERSESPLGRSNSLVRREGTLESQSVGAQSLGGFGRHDSVKDSGPAPLTNRRMSFAFDQDNIDIMKAMRKAQNTEGLDAGQITPDIRGSMRMSRQLSFGQLSKSNSQFLDLLDLGSNSAIHLGDGDAGEYSRPSTPDGPISPAEGSMKAPAEAGGDSQFLGKINNFGASRDTSRTSSGGPDGVTRTYSQSLLSITEDMPDDNDDGLKVPRLEGLEGITLNNDPFRNRSGGPSGKMLDLNLNENNRLTSSITVRTADHHGPGMDQVDEMEIDDDTTHKEVCQFLYVEYDIPERLRSFYGLQHVRGGQNLGWVDLKKKVINDDFYMEDELRFKRRSYLLRVRMSDGSQRSVLVAENAHVRDVLEAFAKRYNISEWRDFGFARGLSVEEQKQARNDNSSGLITHGYEFLDMHLTFRGQVDLDRTVLFFRKQFFIAEQQKLGTAAYSGGTVALIYAQLREAVLRDSLLATKAQAFKLGALQIIADERKFTNGQMISVETLPQHFQKMSRVDEQLKEWVDKLRTDKLDEPQEAMEQYLLVGSSLPLFGTMMFRCLEQVKSASTADAAMHTPGTDRSGGTLNPLERLKNTRSKPELKERENSNEEAAPQETARMVPVIIGISSHSFQRLHPQHRTLLMSWPLRAIKSPVCSDKNFVCEIDVGGQVFNYSVKCRKPEAIKEAIEFYSRHELAPKPTDYPVFLPEISESAQMRANGDGTDEATVVGLAINRLGDAVLMSRQKNQSPLSAAAFARG